MLLGLPRCYSSANIYHAIIIINSSPGNYQEAEKVIHKSLEDGLELDTVAYNTFIKAMLHAGS